ncbi:hypothetical protein Pla175_20000 [Pirellulimonas nuda]|uniref:F0F1-ATPase subunit (ATPase_gene1) n=1 Tax=Pirellulimonas nuda TaxID=2528009 RepID=A0A518DAV9_9BACT|nr:hypothetical protein [Pirellulimonas nuda]QDU88620.1 hypothetical protein Pla175_20000 [Pirellulimonas nuda]
MGLRPGGESAKEELGDRTPPTALASWWVGRLTFVGLLMVIPGLLGFWLDSQIGSVAVFGVVGFAGGSVLAIRYLIKLTADQSSGRPKRPSGVAANNREK